MASEDAALVARVRAGDEAAFRGLYLAHVGMLVRFAGRFIRPVDSATDVVQDVFAALWTRRAEWQVSGAVRTYLYGAVRRRALAMIRDANVAARAVDGALARGEGLGAGSGPADQALQMEQDELAAMIERAIEALPERQRTAVLLRWNDEMNAAEIGRVLGISDTAVRKLLLAARKRIEAAIQ